MPHRPGNVYTCCPLHCHRLEWRLLNANVLILIQSECWIQDWSDPIHVSLADGSKKFDDAVLCSETDLLDERKWTRRVRRKMSSREAEFRHKHKSGLPSLQASPKEKDRDTSRRAYLPSLRHLPEKKSIFREGFDDSKPIIASTTQVSTTLG